jgi:hypothetical protein
MKTNLIGYWAATALVVFAILSGGLAELIRQPETVKGMVHLGYPVYFITILGFWKVLGAIALLAPGFPRLKEWAYAGIFFDLTGAFVSHAVNGDATWHLIATGSLAALTIVSWALRPSGRRLTATNALNA